MVETSISSEKKDHLIIIWIPFCAKPLCPGYLSTTLSLARHVHGKRKLANRKRGKEGRKEGRKQCDHFGALLEPVLFKNTPLWSHWQREARRGEARGASKVELLPGCLGRAARWFSNMKKQSVSDTLVSSLPVFLSSTSPHWDRRKANFSSFFIALKLFRQPCLKFRLFLSLSALPTRGMQRRKKKKCWARGQTDGRTELESSAQLSSEGTNKKKQVGR